MNFQKGLINLLLMSILILILLIPAVVFIHEATHYIMYTLEEMEVTSLHIFDSLSFEKGLSGYITSVKDSQYGIFFQEAIAILCSCLFLASVLLFCLIKPLKPFTIQQLERMGIKRKT